MTKHKIILTLIGSLCLAVFLYFNQLSSPKKMIGMDEEMESSIKKRNETHSLPHKRAFNVQDKLVDSKNNGDENHPKDKNPIDNTVDSEQLHEFATAGFFNQDNTLDSDIVKQYLNSDDFDKFIFGLSNDTSESAVKRGLALEDSLNDLAELEPYNQHSSCGNGICAVKVGYVESADAARLSDLILTNLETGVVFTKNIKTVDGYSEIRILYDGDPQKESVLVLAPGTTL